MRHKRLVTPCAPLNTAQIVGAALTLTLLVGCQTTAQSPDDDSPATIAIEGNGFTVEEVTDDLIFPAGIAVAPDHTTYLVAGEHDERYLVVWNPDLDDWHVVSAAEGGFDDPRHVTVSAAGEVYVANAGNDTISVGEPGGTMWSHLSDPSFDAPVSLAIGSRGELAVINSGDASIAVSEDAGDSWVTFDSELTGLLTPSAIDVTVEGNVIITDAARDAIAIGLNGGEQWVEVSNLVGFSMPVSVDSSADGTIYIANAGNASLIWSEDQGQTWSTERNFGEIAALAVGPDGSLYVTDGLTSAARISRPPGQVIELGAEERDGSVSVEWVAPQVTGGQEITGYVVSLIAADGSESPTLTELIEIVEPHVNSATFHDVNLAGLVAQVQAANDNGLGAVATKNVKEGHSQHG